ncbi:MAG: 5-formyltetrahydrofolate cyclo-ligase [Buchnera aphidicola (Melaphis rhois)]
MFVIDRTFQRAYFRMLRKKIGIKEQKISSLKISDKIFNCKLLCSCKNVAVFISFDGEIDTSQLISELWKKKYNVFLPIIDSIFNKTLFFSQYFPNTRLQLNKFNIFEPIIRKEVVVSCQEMDVIMVPLVAFDIFGYRLGMGGGFYDKILNSYKNKFFPVGLAYDFQLVNKIIPKPWEIPLPAVFTPNKLWKWNFNNFK